ncbi:hypothetical protein [Hymenobacter elongatus]|uniref:Uncharacterized protein n=1 Tax=Hymenobacter elongatus TaxID=877208 RepID=A0A4Z0PS71_9BACT|nr:hypothetical protein [Hymenobacter elongatus]TGE18662.1 hypothetical protein E5J99_04980 [Hymenobacter elongatus]
MKKEVWAQSIRGNRLLRKRDWFGDVLGVCQVTSLHLVFCILFAAQFQEDGRSSNGIPMLCLALVSVPLCAIYCLSRENDLTLVGTGLSAVENRNLVLFAFKTLGWEVRSNTPFAVIAGANNKWWSNHGQTATALITDNKVYLNLIHGGTSKGRLPFYFGSNQRKLNRAIAAIESGKTLLVYQP